MALYNLDYIVPVDTLLKISALALFSISVQNCAITVEKSYKMHIEKKGVPGGKICPPGNQKKTTEKKKMSRANHPGRNSPEKGPTLANFMSAVFGPIPSETATTRLSR